MSVFLFLFSAFTACLAGDSPLQKEGCKNGLNCTRRQGNTSACPAGFFCPDSSTSPIPCPEGTFRSAGLSSSLSCVACPADFFNAKIGQVACLPCGSEAVQPKEGQNTCVCLRQGRVFQPSDAQCPCAPGYKSLTEDRRWDCVKDTYDICRDDAVRNQDGRCLTKEEWPRYCSDQVCDISKDYRGYDKVLGLCLCRVGSLESMCNLPCRQQQRGVLKFFCEQGPARLSLMYRNGRQVDIFWEGLAASLQGLNFHAWNGCAPENQDPRPVYVVKANGRGFLGVYDPEPEVLQHFFAQSQIPPASRDVPWSAKSSDTSWTSAKGGSRFYQPEPANSTQRNTFTGILNPTVCLKRHEILMFIVSKDHYPVYDVNNLYNTNRDFDWGTFRKLAEEMRLASSSTNFFLFFYQFHDPGTYVLRLSSNQHKKMYVRILPFGGQCYEEGPFYPTTPGYVVQVGIAKISDLVLKLDWPTMVGIIIALIFLVLTYLVLIILCQAFGWARKESSSPRFRKLQLKYNLDQYASRESKVVVIQKHQLGMQARGCLEKNSNHVERREDQCKIWDSEEHIDLDSFNTNVFFEILLTQSLAVTTKLSQFKEEVKTIYFKLLEETASLRDLWVAKMCIPDGGEPCNDTLMGDYMEAKEQAEEEIGCRRHRAAEYEESLNRQIDLLTQYLKHEEEHWVAFNSALQEAVRQVEMLEDVLSREDLGSNSKPDHQGLLSLIDATSEKLTNLVMKESHRLMQWGILGEGTGAGLLNKEKTTVLTKEELVEPGGSLKTGEILHQDVAMGLIMPSEDAAMLLANQSVRSASPNLFLHPGTGKLLPIAGNVGFDPIRSKLIPVVDLVSGEIQHHSELPIFPFVPYPVCPETGLPGRVNLPVLQPEKVFKLGGLMQDPVTGMEVPILAITAHPQTGQQLTLGGTYLNPLTGMVAPLEIGGPMKAEESGKIVPILGVSLDNNTGIIVPVGGLQGHSGDILLPGDPFVEPLSGKMALMQGLSLQQDKVVPHAGSYQVLLEANILITQILMVQALQEYKDSICKDLCPTGTLQKVLNGAEEAMKMALAQKLDYLMYQLQNLEKQRDSASSVKRTGGKLGMIKYPSTELWIPAVFGMKIPDPGGSELMVPILGVECDWKTGQPMPLAGVTEDADGKGLVPITIGFRAIDPIIGEMGPVIGAQINPWTKAVLPVVQSQGSLPRENVDTDLLATLAKERMARQVYWRSQREKEQEIFKEVNCLCRDMLDAAREGKMRKFRDKLKPADKICRLLELSSAQESQRQADRDLTALGNPERSLWSRVDKDEKDQEARVQLLLRKTLEKLVQFIQKVQLEEGRIQMQLKEAERHWSRNFCAREAIKEKFRKAKLHLLAELQDHIAKQQTRVETEYCRLEYLRFLSDIVAFQTKDRLSGSSQCFMNYPGARFYSMAAVPCGSWEVINRKLIPLLKSVAQTLEENKRGSSSPEEGLESGEGYTSRSTLKVSGAPGKTLRTEPRQVRAAAAAPSPVLLRHPAMNKSQLLQEIQTRVFLEKHTREMVQLELSLMGEEIHMISCFWESSQLKTKQGEEGKQKLASEWDRLLKELIEHHQHAEGDLGQLQREAVKYAGLCPIDINLKEGASVPLEEIFQSFSLLSIDLQKACSLSQKESAKGSVEAPRSEAKLCTDPVAQKIQATAVKIVKEEALKLLRVYQVLDAYISLQKQSCPRDVLQALEQLPYAIMGETVSQDVLHWAERHQVEEAESFLLKSHLDGDLTLPFKETDEAELMELQAQIRMELQAQIEKKLESKEMEVIQEAAKLPSRFPVEHVTFFLLSQRYLRQAVLLLEGGLKVPQMDVLLAEDMETILHLLKGRKEWEDSLEELQQVTLMLQLKERQFQEMVRLLKAESSSEDPDDAYRIANNLQEFRQQKIKELAEQLKTLLPTGQNTREDSSEDSSLLQGQDESSLAEDRVLSLLAEKTKILKQTELLVTLRLILLNPHFRPLQFDDDEVSNITSSQLLTLLKDVSGYFQKYAINLGLQDTHHQESVLDPSWTKRDPEDTDNSFQDILDLQVIPESGELVPLPASSLSAREFVIYQYGIVILQFLRPYIGAPEVELRLASRIPSSKAPGNAFRNTFYYQTPGNQLFVLRESLACAGSFVLLLVHCLAHITADDFSQDSHPAFRRLFYQALKACLGETFSLRLQASAFLEDSKSAATVINQTFLKRGEASADLLSELLDAKAKGCMTAQKDVSRATEVGLPIDQVEVQPLEKPLLGQEIEKLQREASEGPMA